MSSPASPTSPLAAPEVPRVLPMLAYLLIPVLGASLVPHPDYWLYGVKVLVVSGLVWSLRARLPELKLSFSWVAVLVGVLVAVLWEILPRYVPGLERLYQLALHFTTGRELPPVKPADAWTPLTVFRDTPALAYGFVVLRVLGRSLLVPLVEEVFYRSFVYRYIISPRFESIALATRHIPAWLATSAIFGLAHPDQWLAGFGCGLAYQWLVIRSGRLGDSILAHAITNGLLSAWVIYEGTWDFS